MHGDGDRLCERGGQPDIVADAVVYMLNQPDGIAINELVIRPTGQLFP